MTSHAGVGPGVPGESVYNLAAASDTTGVTYILPAPTGRYATSSFKCENISTRSCEQNPPCPQVCDYTSPALNNNLLFNLSGASPASNMRLPRCSLLLMNVPRSPDVRTQL